MDRVRDYIGFVIWFSGIGYVASWPLLAPDIGLLSGTAFCTDGLPTLLHWLCVEPAPGVLPPGVHAIGLVSAGLVTVQLPFALVRVSRKRRAGGKTFRPMRRRRSRPPAPLRVKPRNHFGLRGTPR